jgi:diaminopimelate decarboxylase
MPRVEIFYAMKVNPDLEICKICADNGLGFDIASKKEME